MSSNFVGHGIGHAGGDALSLEEIIKREKLSLEEKYILVLLIKLLKNLTIGLMDMELFICMLALNPLDSFASYDAQKVMRLAQFYPNDISSVELIRLEFQLETFIDDMRKDDRFKCVEHLGELSTLLVETKKHLVYDLVYLLLKLISILPVATANVERVFSAMALVKNKLRNSMGDALLKHCLVTFIERDMFLKVSEDDIVATFMAMRERRVTKS